MLYDPKWEIETKIDIWSLRDLIAWLETKPADEAYCYVESGRCMIAQYLKAKGWAEPRVDPDYVDDFSSGERKILPDGWDYVAYGRGEGATFGAALNRARELLARAE